MSRIFSASSLFSSCLSSFGSLGCFLSGLSCLVWGVASVFSTDETVRELRSEGDPLIGGNTFFLHLVNPSGTVERKPCKTDSKLEDSRSGSDPRHDNVERRLAATRTLSFRLRLCSAASRSRFSYSRVKRGYIQIRCNSVQANLRVTV